MAQYFLTGWFVGEPGTDEVHVAYPPEWEEVEVELTPKEGSEIETAWGTVRYNDSEGNAFGRSVVITWSNSTDTNSPFDYRITQKETEQ